MRDLDSAVGRLDNIFMSVYVIIAALIIAVGLVRFATLCRNVSSEIAWLLGSSSCYLSDRSWHTYSWYAEPSSSVKMPS